MDSCSREGVGVGVHAFSRSCARLERHVRFATDLGHTILLPRIAMRLLVKVHGLEFVVPCGDGSQSVKWLGLAVAQRYALAAPHGRCRTREDAHVKQGFFLPANVLKATTTAATTGHQSLSPASRIAEVCKDNDTIIVQLQVRIHACLSVAQSNLRWYELTHVHGRITQQEVPVNEIGTPQFAPWTVRAFASASSQQQQRSAGGAPTASGSKASFTTSADAKAHASSSSYASSSHMFHADAKTAGPNSDERKGKGSIENDMKAYARAELLQQVNSGQFQSEMEVEAAFLYDWSRLRIDDLEKDVKERDAIQELLLAHFAHLNAAFMHYAVGSGEMAFGMNGHEFVHFVHECGLSHFETDRRALERVVTQSLKHDSLASLHDRGTLSRVGFVHALLRVILSHVASSSASGAKDNNAATAFRDAIEKSLQSNVAPAVTRLTSGPFRDHSHHDVRAQDRCLRSLVGCEHCWLTLTLASATLRCQRHRLVGTNV